MTSVQEYNESIIADKNAAALYQEYVDGAADLGRTDGPYREKRVLEVAIRRGWALLDPVVATDIYESEKGEELLDWLSEGDFVPDQLENMIAAAEQHGEDSDPDHTVGDLQDWLRLVVGGLDEQATRAFFKDETIVALTHQGKAAATRETRNGW